MGGLWKKLGEGLFRPLENQRRLGKIRGVLTQAVHELEKAEGRLIWAAHELGEAIAVDARKSRRDLME